MIIIRPKKYFNDIDELLFLLNPVVLNSHTLWVMFHQLFVYDNERSNLRNKIAHGFFNHVYFSFIDRIYINIACLTDPLGTRKKPNLTLRRLVNSLEITKDLDLIKFSKHQLNNILIKSIPFRNWRNKRIAHLDLLLAKETYPISLESPQLSDIDYMLEMIENLILTIFNKLDYIVVPTTFKDIKIKGDVNDLFDAMNITS